MTVADLFEKSRNIDKSLNLRWAVPSQFRSELLLLQNPYGDVIYINKIEVCSDVDFGL